MTRRARIFTAAAACALALPASALGAGNAEVSMMDDQALLGTSKAKIDQTLTYMRAYGADRLRVSAFWSDIAPSPTSVTRPGGFDAANPFDAKYHWAALDRVVAAAAAHGMKVMISISTPIPYWASAEPRRRNRVWKPDPQEFARFAFAVAGRYRFQADQYGLLNEPNQGAWLQPQSDRTGAVSPHVYRALVQSSYPVVKFADPDSTVLVGELAPSGRDDPGTTRPIRPLRFLRAMGCVNERFRPLRTGPCKGFKAVPIDALGHHPYALFSSPSARSLKRDDAAMGDWRRLESTLDRLVARKALAPSGIRRLDVHYTEFGYQTDPPDPFAGIPLARQSRWLQDAGYVAWRTPRVRQVNQFRLTDGHIRGSGPLSFREFQSGLFFADGKAKPSARTFPAPLVIVKSGSSALLWGAARAGHGESVLIERRRGNGSFRRFKLVRANKYGYFRLRVSRGSGQYRYQYGPRAAFHSQAVSAPR